MGDFKTCDIHDKEFPANMIDLSKSTMVKLYAEKEETIDGKKVNLSLFIGQNANEGADSCHKCAMDSLIRRLEGLGIPFAWKVVSWHNETVAKRDGSGTYQKLIKTVETVDEYRTRLQAEKAKTAPTPTAK